MIFFRHFRQEMKASTQWGVCSLSTLTLLFWSTWRLFSKASMCFIFSSQLWCCSQPLSLSQWPLICLQFTVWSCEFWKTFWKLQLYGWGCRFQLVITITHECFLYVSACDYWFHFNRRKEKKKIAVWVKSNQENLLTISFTVYVIAFQH